MSSDKIFLSRGNQSLVVALSSYTERGYKLNFLTRLSSFWCDLAWREL